MNESNMKDTNPKDALGSAKPPMSTVSGTVMAEVGVAMMEGARKYGRHNYRTIGVRAGVYYDACWRHMLSWWEGQDIDPDSGLSHVTKAIATLMVLRDAMIQGKLNDDRPPKAPEGFFEKLKTFSAAVLARYPESKEPFTQLNKPIHVTLGPVTYSATHLYSPGTISVIPEDQKFMCHVCDCTSPVTEMCPHCHKCPHCCKDI